MSDDIPSPSTSASKTTANSTNVHVRRNRKKHEKLKLPTPPPDPREDKKESCTENDFLEYLENLHKHTANYSRSSSTLASALVTEDAFDHLERLYKLMEQMLELRAQNAKLHKKIRDLEHLNNLEKMYREVESQAEDDTCSELDKDTAFAETILESILYEPKQYLKSKGSLRQSLMGKHRNRSSSAIDKPIGLDTVEPTEPRRASLTVSSTKKPSKVSKWTKVKAAFKWEKASPTVGDAKSLDSGISGIAPVEVVTYLRVPSHDDAGHSPSDSGAAEISTPGSLSSASSNENFHKAGHRSLYEEQRSSDDEHSHIYSSHSKEDANISPPSSQRSHRTPWARMKDIMNTRNPVRKKKLSSQSDDIQIDIELCSDNEEVFESTSKSNSFSNFAEPSCEKLGSENEIPLEVRQRYKSNDENCTEHNQQEGRKISKWTKVKKAFLPALESNMDSEIKDDIEGEGKDRIQSEINRNYRHLQKKLSMEFQEKLDEWKKIKHNNSSAANPVPSCSNTEEALPPNTAFMKKMEEWEKIKSQPTRTKCNIRMTREENLPPDFKKKLHEWEKMKKVSVRKSVKKVDDIPRWKSTQYSKSPETPHIEIPVISEEFKKKLEEWKQIKASGYKSDDTEKKNMGNKTPSPKLNRIDSKAMKQQDRELQWYEKELNKIEKEKGRLERERQKFMETEERLSKLRKSVSGGNKKDILVHTSSGFYKFEGISRKFTQKLYEWEKSRGIGPESSTFALLTPDYPNPTIPKVKINGEDQTPPFTRSRSVDSVVASTINVESALKSQPSSLSLNDVDEFENNCLDDSKTFSVDYLPCCVIDAEEPEAIIVEVEDFVEETAAPLKSFIEQHNPVYQCERVRALCEGETCLAPKIRRSESARAQTNYNLIEEIFNVLHDIADYDVHIRKIQVTCPDDSKDMQQIYENQKHLTHKLIEKLQRLQEANALVVLNITKENQDSQSNHIIDILDIVQDLSIEIVALSEKLDEQINEIVNGKLNCQVFDELSIQEIIEEIKCKLLELRRHLSYVCAASDSASPMRRGLCRMKSIVCKKSSNESHGTDSDLSQVSDVLGPTKSVGIYEKFEAKTNHCQGAVKKRIRCRAEHTRRKSLQDSDEEDNPIGADQIKCPKFLRARTLSETSTKSSDEEEAVTNRNNNIFPVASKSTFIEAPARINPTDSPVTIFVKTTRKLFTPFIERSLNEQNSQRKEFENTSDDTPENVQIGSDKIETNIDEENQESLPVQNVEISGLPPIPSSPSPQKRYLKDISPSIRLMLSKYHQKICEQDSSNKSGGSSGSASPVAWRSPTAERRVKAQMVKYQEEIAKSASMPACREVHKSASQSAIERKLFSSKIVKPNTTCTERNILKSTSAANLIYKNSEEHFVPARSASEKSGTPIQSKILNSITSTDQMDLIWSERCSERLRKLKKAKEEFFNSGPSSAPPLDTTSEMVLQYPKRNRLSQISVESSSSTGSISPGILVKSVSAGMINIAEEAYKQFEGTKPREYVSLPRNTQPGTSKKSAFNNIAAKFRRVKMRRGKEREKERFPVVSELCRQSLVVDINQSENQQQVCNSDSTTCINRSTQFEPVSIPKSNSWISKTNLFKK